MENNHHQVQFGREVLGPLIERYCFKLWLSESYYDENDSALLFLSRGGLRLRYYYQFFLKKYQLTSKLIHNDLYVSRIAVHKAALICDARPSAELIAKEFEWSSVHDAFSAIFGEELIEAWVGQLSDEEVDKISKERMTPQHLLDVLANSRGADAPLNAYLKQHFELFQSHIRQQTKGRKNLLLVDTGWSGSIVKSIKALLPDQNILGCYYGKFSYGKPIDEGWYNDILGLEVEGIRYKWNIPGTSIFLYRHLLEGLCEVDWPSVEAYQKDESGQVISSHGKFHDSLRRPLQGDGLGQGVIQYLESIQKSRQVYTCLEVGNEAVVKLNRIIVFPNRRDTLLTVGHRSADFGKGIDVPVLLPAAGRFEFRKKIKNIGNSLWTSAQITLEFPVVYPFVQLAYYLKMIKGGL